MEKPDLILIEHLCVHWGVELSFFTSLHDTGLISITVIEDQHYIPTGQLAEMEKMLRFHKDLDINVEGIDVIANLLNRITELQQELAATKNRLRLYEDQ